MAIRVGKSSKCDRISSLIWKVADTDLSSSCTQEISTLWKDGSEEKRQLKANS